MNPKKSVSHQRTVKGYLKPSHFEFITGYSALNATSQSKVLSLAVKKMYEATPAPERERIKRAAGGKNAY